MTIEGGYSSAKEAGLAKVWRLAKRGVVEGVTGEDIPAFSPGKDGRIVGLCRIEADRAWLDGEDLVVFKADEPNPG
jgi:hypothetical protein